MTERPPASGAAGIPESPQDPILLAANEPHTRSDEPHGERDTQLSSRRDNEAAAGSDTQPLASLAMLALTLGASGPPKKLATVQDRVEAKEAAMHEALEGLAQIKAKITDSGAKSTEMDLQVWSDDLRYVNNIVVDFEYLVGTAGSTGMGKSSLLNALISPEGDIAPSSQRGACTSVVCRYRYHDKGEAEAPLIARITFKSKATVDEELLNFFLERKEILKDADCDENPVDSELLSERDRMTQKLNIIEEWSGLPRLEIIEHGTSGHASKITRRCRNGESIFNYARPEVKFSLSIGERDEDKFLQQIRPYVGNTKTQGQLMWPLVETVDVYVDSPILRNGVVLVDLPGEMDALESRVQVARDNYNKLDRHMVIAPGDRALDEQVASELMRDDQFVDLEASGKMAGDGLCLVATKIDEMNWRDYLQERPSPADISPDLPQLISSLAVHDDRLRLVDDQVSELKGSIAAASRHMRPPRPPTDVSRPIADDSEAFSNLQSMFVLGMQRDQLREDIANLEEQCLRACIEDRNRDIAAKLKEWMQKTRKDLLSSQESKIQPEISVFSVSSHAHRNLMRNKPQPAFRNSAATGIEALTDWIRAGSLPKREQHADTVLSHCQVLYDRIADWAVEEWLSSLELPESTLPRIQAELAAPLEGLRNDALKAGQLLKNYIKIHPKFKVMHPTPGSTDELKRHINSYSRTNTGAPVHWMTYKACVRRSGGAFVKKGGRHSQALNWMSAAYAYFWKPYMGLWTSKFNERIPLYRARFNRKFEKAGSDYFQKLLESPTLPDQYKDGCNLYIHTVANAQQIYENFIWQKVEEYRLTCQSIRVSSKDIIRKPFSAAYAEAQSHSGRGIKAMQMATMERHAPLIDKELCEVVTPQLGQLFKKAHASTCQEIDDEIAAYVERMDQILQRVAAFLCSVERRRAEQGTTVEAIKNLKNSVRQDIEHWKFKWWSLHAQLAGSEVSVAEESAGDYEHDEHGCAKIAVNDKKRAIKDESLECEVPLAKIRRRE